MAAQANAQSTSANPPVQVKAAQEEQTASITPEQLLSSIEYEMLDAVTYQCLAARMSGCAQKTLRALAQVSSLLPLFSQCDPAGRKPAKTE